MTQLPQKEYKMVVFKKLDIKDWAKVQKIAYETWPNTFGQLLPGEQIDYMLQLIYNEESLKKQILEKGHQFLLAEKDDQTLGFASYEMNYNSEPQLMIHKLYLLPTTQGLGIGTNFINLLSEIAKQNKNNQLRLKVYFKNTNAIRFYEKYGFIKTGTETTDIGNNYKILDNVMIKQLL
jgi:ribosomal protein S18 acetylase RimI-like enzyme